MNGEVLSFKTDVYSRVTNEIVKAIEAGASQFRMPWHQQAGAGRPRNAATSNFYQGVNTLALWAAASQRGYGVPYWASYRQWLKLGAQVRRHETSTVVVFYKSKDTTVDPKPENEKKEARALLRYSTVFNAAQVDGWQRPEGLRQNRTTRLANVDAFVSALAADVSYGHQIACYNRAADGIYMPDRRLFVESSDMTATEGFYSVLLHEHVHWSGHPKRLNRDLSGRFGTEAYAMEELVAELGAAFLCADLGISVEPRRNHASYLASWLKILGQQKTAIFIAATAATTACRFLSSGAMNGRDM